MAGKWPNFKYILEGLIIGFQTFIMTFEGLGEMYEGDSTDSFAEKYPLVLMGGGKRRVPRTQTRERGPPSVLVEIYQK